MQLIRGLHNLKSQFTKGSVATIGNYDGVHLGHQEILDVVRRKSAELNLPAVVATFEPQPEEFFTGDKSLRITSLREKIALLEQQGIDKILLLPFNAHFASIGAQQFIDKILVQALQVQCLVVGDDFVFGHNRTGDFTLLKQEAVRRGFQVIKIDSFKIDGVRVSSSLIRTALLQGNLNFAAKFLGGPYKVCGRVVHGEHRGRDIGFPTANIYLKQSELPLTGVYGVKIYNLMPTPLLGVANVGFRPTVFGEHKRVEIYIFDFNRDIYGNKIIIEFCQKIRDEKKFSSLQELQLQIKKDVAMAKELRL